MRKLNLVVVAACLVAFVSTAHAQWGDLKVKFVYDGTAPKPAAIDVNKDTAFCGKHNLVQESLVINPKNGGVQNVIGYLYLGRGKKAPKPHPDYDKTAQAKIKFDNINCRFEPRVICLRTSQTVQLGNPDPVGHNTKVDTFTNPAINPVIPGGGTLLHKFDTAERLPAGVSCSIHPWMKGWLVIKDHPYMAVSDENGELSIEKLPAGKWTIQFWQEQAGYVSDVSPKPWKRGRAEVEIKSNAVTDLGVVKINPNAFNK
ncbi:MAG: hypothetical protein QGG36_13570 [Pirellulaceae bacterium]|jgi:plastocyanin|nr:hypothetical protein [Pirellulaceae bacterium]MDP7016826.1 hypothetical protein [Pirellulaceae bacterium]